MLANANVHFITKVRSGAGAYCLLLSPFSVPIIRKAIVQQIVNNKRAFGCDLAVYRFMCRPYVFYPGGTLHLTVMKSPPVEVTKSSGLVS